jgi:signal peptidase I
MNDSNYDPFTPPAPVPAPVEPERWAEPVRVPPDPPRPAEPGPTIEEAALPERGRMALQAAPASGDDPATLQEASLVLSEPSPATGGLAAAEPMPAMAGLVVLPDARPAHLENQGVLHRLGEETVAWLKTLASAAVYATLIVTFGFQVARVEGQSMAPTLSDQDRLIVNKFAYRIGEPQVGDIVMLYYPLNPEKSFVKRVIAEEGDQVRIVDGRVYRNDVLINDDYVPAEYRSHDDWGPEVIPEGYYFVMGDHRNNSSDSRHWRFVPKKYIIGKVQVRWWPIPEARIF